MTEERAPTPSGTPTLAAAPADPFLERLREAGGAHAAALREGRDMPVLEVPRERWRVLAASLRFDPALAFDYCVAVTATDELPEVPRFRVVAVLHSHRHGRRARLRCAAGEGEDVPSLVPVWSGANWMEREVFDLFGIRFEGHPDLRRILMPEAYGWHPLRKDFPLEGIEPDRLYRQWERDRVLRPRGAE